MRRLGLVLACLVVAVGASWFLGAGAALAGSGNGCPGSAGDSQYVDPLGCPTTSTSTSTSPPPTNSTPPPSTSTTPPATVATTTVSSTTAPDPSSHSLPFTGLDVWTAAGLGLGLLGTGIAIRRLQSSER